MVGSGRAGYAEAVSTSSPDVDSPLVDSDSPLDTRVEVAAQSRGPLLLREWPLTAVIGVIGVGLIVIAMHHFRWGSLAIASGTLVAAFLRLVLPARRIGLLAVRGRIIDVVTMGSIGIALMVLALVTKT
jgi:hypothetical protein